jgi:hypothetical protein
MKSLEFIDCIKVNEQTNQCEMCTKNKIFQNGDCSTAEACETGCDHCAKDENGQHQCLVCSPNYFKADSTNDCVKSYREQNSAIKNCLRYDLTAFVKENGDNVLRCYECDNFFSVSKSGIYCVGFQLYSGCKSYNADNECQCYASHGRNASNQCTKIPVMPNENSIDLTLSPNHEESTYLINCVEANERSQKCELCQPTLL